MPKTFYTERDIEDFAKQGVGSLEIGDDVVITDLARDKASRLGIELVRSNDKPPAAPERPYLAESPSPSATSAKPASATPVIAPVTESPASSDDLYSRVYTAVVARLGDTVDPQLLETIIKRVLENVSTK